MEVDAVDFSIFVIQTLDKIAKAKRLPITPRVFDVKSALPFPNGYFDAIYSHMLLNMRFSLDELHFIFSEMRRVLKPKFC
jgi:SAM-dependent methyltransferase